MDVSMVLVSIIGIIMGQVFRLCDLLLKVVVVWFRQKVVSIMMKLDYDIVCFVRCGSLFIVFVWL